jgi:hypothetical protein
VRIGVSGTGVAPNYKIEYPTDQPDLVLISLTLRAQPADTYNGRSHRELRHLDDLMRGEQWSTRGLDRDVASEAKEWVAERTCQA